MKIYSRSEFMKLPSGTVFSSGENNCFMDLHIKGETWEVDFLQSSLIGIDSFSSEENADRMDEMEERGVSYPINRSYGREGLFDDNMLYLVYEREDMAYMIREFQKALMAIKDTSLPSTDPKCEAHDGDVPPSPPS